MCGLLQLVQLCVDPYFYFAKRRCVCGFMRSARGVYERPASMDERKAPAEEPKTRKRAAVEDAGTRKRAATGATGIAWV